MGRFCGPSLSTLFWACFSEAAPREQRWNKLIANFSRRVFCCCSFNVCILLCFGEIGSTQEAIKITQRPVTTAITTTISLKPEEANTVVCNCVLPIVSHPNQNLHPYQRAPMHDQTRPTPLIPTPSLCRQTTSNMSQNRPSFKPCFELGLNQTQVLKLGP